MSRPVWNVSVTREDGYWVAVVDGLRGGATEARRLDRLEDEVRDLVAWLVGGAEDAFDLVWEYDLPPDLAVRVRTFTKQREALKRAQGDYEHAARDAVAEARRHSISVRDVGALLGLSHQRVQQIDAAIRGDGGRASRPGRATARAAVDAGQGRAEVGRARLGREGVSWS